jgi:hypothetical protein
LQEVFLVGTEIFQIFRRDCPSCQLFGPSDICWKYLFMIPGRYIYMGGQQGINSWLNQVRRLIAFGRVCLRVMGNITGWEPKGAARIMKQFHLSCYWEWEYPILVFPRMNNGRTKIKCAKSVATPLPRASNYGERISPGAC